MASRRVQTGGVALSAAGSSESLDAQLARFQRGNDKMQRMAGKIGTAADNSEFRDHIAREKAEAAQLAKAIAERIKRENSGSSGSVGARRLLRQFETEYNRFSSLVDSIDLKQKQQLVAFSHTHPNPIGDALAREEESGPQAGSFQQGQLPSDIEFLQYEVDEVERRHAEIRAVERDVQEVGAIFKDLALLVDEQQVQIDVIDANITSTRDHAEEGLKDLISAEAHQRTARKRMCCVLSLVIVILVIIVVVVLFLKGKF